MPHTEAKQYRYDEGDNQFQGKFDMANDGRRLKASVCKGQEIGHKIAIENARQNSNGGAKIDGEVSNRAQI